MSRSSSSCSSNSSRTPSPKSRILKVSNLTANVNRNHLFEIFENYGDVKTVELAEKQGKEGKLKRGYAYVEMLHKFDAANAKRGMDGGWIDGNIIGVSQVHERTRNQRKRRRSRSPTYRKRRRSHSDCSDCRSRD